LLKGEVVEGSIGGEQQVVVVVSAEARSESWPTVIVAPIVQQVGQALLDLPTSIELGDGEPVDGHVLLDFLTLVASSELEAGRSHGFISRAALDAIDAALPLVFGILPL
jgi:mRNA-degrading endonuclease toxin of MazEF toxin-antitoxin module